MAPLHDPPSPASQDGGGKKKKKAGPKKAGPKKAKKTGSKNKVGGGVMEDLGKLIIPLGLIAAKEALVAMRSKKAATKKRTQRGGGDGDVMPSSQEQFGSATLAAVDAPSTLVGGAKKKKAGTKVKRAGTKAKKTSGGKKRRTQRGGDGDATGGGVLPSVEAPFSNEVFSPVDASPMSPALSPMVGGAKKKTAAKKTVKKTGAGKKRRTQKGGADDAAGVLPSVEAAPLAGGAKKKTAKKTTTKKKKTTKKTKSGSKHKAFFRSISGGAPISGGGGPNAALIGAFTDVAKGMMPAQVGGVDPFSSMRTAFAQFTSA